MCFVWIWEQTAIISLYSINWLVFITETECIYCAVRNRSLYIIRLSLCKGSIWTTLHFSSYFFVACTPVCLHSHYRWYRSWEQGPGDLLAVMNYTVAHPANQPAPQNTLTSPALLRRLIHHFAFKSHRIISCCSFVPFFRTLAPAAPQFRQLVRRMFPLVVTWLAGSFSNSLCYGREMIPVSSFCYRCQDFFCLVTSCDRLVCTALQKRADLLKTREQEMLCISARAIWTAQSRTVHEARVDVLFEPAFN